MIPVEMMEGAIDEVVDVVAVRNGGVPTARVVPGRALDGRAGRRVTPVHLEDVLRNTRIAGGVELPIVEIIGVIAMTNGSMTTARPVNVGVVVRVLHGDSSSSGESMVRHGSRGQVAAVSS